MSGKSRRKLGNGSIGQFGVDLKGAGRSEQGEVSRSTQY
jgi:hypothetical protein